MSQTATTPITKVCFKKAKLDLVPVMRLFNYKARKVALMTGFNSMSSNMIPNLLFLIRMLHLHLFKKVVLYL